MSRLIDADKLKVIMRDSTGAVIVTDYTGEKTACFGLTEKEILQIIDNAPTVESRMLYVQETVNTILNYCTGNTDIDKAFRNAARLVQNAIDGESVDFEQIERSEEE